MKKNIFTNKGNLARRQKGQNVYPCGWWDRENGDLVILVQNNSKNINFMVKHGRD